MKITDKRNVTQMDSVPDYGDVLMVQYEDGETDVYVVVPSVEREGKLLLNVHVGSYWEVTARDPDYTVADYLSVFDDGGCFPVAAIDHIPNSHLELVIGG